MKPTTYRRGTQTRAQAGQAMLEYLLLCAALAAVLFVPVLDNPASPDQPRSTLQLVLDGFRTAYQHISHAISLPT